MQVVKSYPNGVVSWVDLGTTDADGAKDFYGGLFGWEFDDTFDEEGRLIYRMAKLSGYSVAGLGEQDEGTRAQGIPPLWNTYINHNDLGAVAERAARAGGMVLVPPMDVLGEGRMALIMDPSGAMFGVWEPARHTGAQLVNMPNTLVWNELQTRAIDAARDFYHEVFGWEYDVNSQGYVSCKVDGRSQAGMMAIDESWGEVPSNWGVYFLVEDAAQSVTRAEELGATVLMPLTTAEGVGSFAVIRDPQGAVFSIIEYSEMPPSPPPGYD